MSVGSNRSRTNSIDSKRSNRNDIIARNIKAITNRNTTNSATKRNTTDNKIRKPSPITNNYIRK